MKNRIYLLSLFLVSCLLSLIAVPRANAAVSCQPIYGGGQTCVTIGSAVINKKILNPSTSVFVDNLGINDPKYQPGYIVNFRIEVTNNGDTNIPRVDMKDIFPAHVEFGSGPGNFDTKTKTLTFSIDNLAPNETRIFAVVGKVVAINQIPANQSIICVVNQAIATTSEGAISQDNSQFCIERKVTATTKGGFPVLSPVPVYATPSTGPESMVLFSLIPAGLTGWLLRKHSLKNKRREN